MNPSKEAWRVIEELLGNPSAALENPVQNDMLIGSLEDAVSPIQTKTIENNEITTVTD